MGKLSKLSRNKRTEAAKRVKAEQPIRTEINRKRKLTRHLRGHPGDLVAMRGLRGTVK